jgi:hypothetical protein
MIRQLFSLATLLTAASLVVAWCLMPNSTLANDVVQAFGEQDAIAIAAQGSARAFLALQCKSAADLFPWFAAGMLAASVARAGLWLWTRPAEVPEKIILRDEAGGTVTMYANPLSHDPGIRFLSDETPKTYLEGATDFENELFQLIAATGSMPAELSRGMAVTLQEHVRSAYTHIVQTHGPGSLASSLVIAYQCGKVVAFQSEKGAWVAVSDKFPQQSMVVVRRTRSFYKLAPALREELMRCLGILASNWFPVDLPEEIREVIRSVRISDMSSDSGSATVAKRKDNEIDIRGIATMVSTAIVSIFKDFNVNQIKNRSDALDAIYMKKEAVLLVPPKQMREAFSRLLPADVSAALKLEIPAASRHPSDSILRQVLETTGVLVTVLKSKSCTSGVFSIRSGSRKIPSMWALSSKNIKPEIVDSWADWSYEIEILAPGEIHVG